MQNRLSPLIAAAEVRELQKDSNVTWIDARGGPGAKERYEGGHLPNAIFVDLETELSQKSENPANGGRHPLPDVKQFGVLLGRIGIRPSSHIIIYDDKGGAMAAARFWWMLKAAGHEKVQVVDGGLDALIREGLVLDAGNAKTPASLAPYYIEGWKLPTVTIADVERASANPEYVVIDVRESFRYRGEREPIDLVAGHIPGAVNIPFMENNLQSDGRFQTAEALTSTYRSFIGNRPLENVIVHCGSGVTACHTLLALHQAGLEGARLYVGSWSEWSRSGRPIATGDQQDCLV
ncbi:MAG: sulfurtransferase [Cyclobacteriaceae bacterium]|nr:sulfurtransferase [Cyclobacteriaceae bacterium]